MVLEGGGPRDDMHDGDEIKIDLQNNIFLRTSDDNYYRMRKYDKEGRLLELHITKRSKDYSTKNHKEYIKYYETLDKANKLKIGNPISMGDLFQSEYLLSGGYMYDKLYRCISSNFNRKKEVIFYKCVGAWANNGLPIKTQQLVKSSNKYDSFSVIVVDNEGNIEKGMEIKTKSAWKFHLLKEDKNGNVYISVNTRGENERNGYEKIWIYKYNDSGTLVSMIELLPEIYPPFIDSNGIIYQIYWTETDKELELIKWEKK